MRFVRPVSVKSTGSRPRTRAVLVVDDDPGCRTALALALESAGYEVLHAHDGADALAILGRGVRPAAIALDLMMPGIDGYEVLAHLVASPSLATIPVVVVSASLEAGEVPRGADAALAKPIDVDAFLDALDGLEDAPSAPANPRSEERRTPRFIGGRDRGWRRGAGSVDPRARDGK